MWQPTTVRSDRDLTRTSCPATTRATRPTAKFAVAVVLCVLVLPPAARWHQQGHLFASPPAASDRFGGAVAVSGDTIVVGAYLDDTVRGVDAGSAFVFTRTAGTWSEQAYLVPADGATEDWFGSSVAIDGDTLVVGANKDDTAAGENVGSAYVFARSGSSWSPDGHLLAGTAYNRTGMAVGISGNTIVVGSVLGNAPGVSGAGTAYVFTRGATSWTLQEQLFASDPGSVDNFGASVAISGDTIVVGAPWWDFTPDDAAGAAYVFTRDGGTWGVPALLIAADLAADDYFGATVAISGDTVVVGSPSDDTAAGIDAGSAYVFVPSGPSWLQQAHLFAADARESDGFGESVGISGNTIVVGARYDKTIAAISAGSAYVFTRAGGAWNQQGHLFADDAVLSDQFGRAVAIDGDTVVVGVQDDDYPGQITAGSAYVYVQSLFDTFIGEPPALLPVPR